MSIIHFSNISKVERLGKLLIDEDLSSYLVHLNILPKVTLKDKLQLFFEQQKPLSKRLSKVLEQFSPTFAAFGRFISIRRDILEPEFCDEFTLITISQDCDIKKQLFTSLELLPKKYRESISAHNVSTLQHIFPHISYKVSIDKKEYSITSVYRKEDILEDCSFLLEIADFLDDTYHKKTNFPFKRLAHEFVSELYHALNIKKQFLDAEYANADVALCEHQKGRPLIGTIPLTHQQIERVAEHLFGTTFEHATLEKRYNFAGLYTTHEALLVEQHPMKIHLSKDQKEHIADLYAGLFLQDATLFAKTICNTTQKRYTTQHTQLKLRRHLEILFHSYKPTQMKPFLERIFDYIRTNHIHLPQYIFYSLYHLDLFESLLPEHATVLDYVSTHMYANAKARTQHILERSYILPQISTQHTPNVAAFYVEFELIARRIIYSVFVSKIGKYKSPSPKKAANSFFRASR